MKASVASLLCSFVACGLVVSPVRAGERVDNPKYKHWAQFKPGSFSEFTEQINRLGTQLQHTTILTLKEVTPENVVLETRTFLVTNGQKSDTATVEDKIPAKVELAKARESDPPKKGDRRDGGEVVDVKQGEEELTICGKTLKTEWVETKLELKGGTATLRTWSCDEVPGRVVKKTKHSEGVLATDSTGEVVDFKADRKAQSKTNTGALSEGVRNNYVYLLVIVLAVGATAFLIVRRMHRPR